MALYPFQCTLCGREQDHVIPTQEYLAGKRPSCEFCYGVLKRLVVPFNEVGTGNRMHHMIDRTLNPGFGPTVFNTRGEWEAAMQRQGVRPMERGDAEAQVKSEARRAAECRERYVKELDQKVDKAIDRAMQERGGL